MKDIAVIDIEASGLHMDSYPIEVAILKQGEVRSWLIKPKSSWTHWCDTAETLHGISRRELNDRGQKIEQVVEEIDAFMGEFTGSLYSDAQVWDADWIDTLYFAGNQSRLFKIDSIYRLLSDLQKTHFAKYKFELAISGNYRHHRAESDVKMIAKAFKMAYKAQR